MGQVGVGVQGEAAETGGEQTREERLTKATQGWPLGFSYVTPPPVCLLAREEKH